MPDALIRQAIEKRDIQNLEVKTTDAAGREKVLDLTLSSVENAWGSTKGISLIARDVTQRRKLEQRVAQAERMAMIGEVAAGVAHEIRNPLFAISSISQILGMECGTNAELAELTRAMSAEIQRLNRIVEDLLTFGRRRDLEVRIARPTTSGRAPHHNVGALTERQLTLQRVDGSPISPAASIPTNAAVLFLTSSSTRFRHRRPAASAPGVGVNGGVEPSWFVHVNQRRAGIPPDARNRIFELFFTTRKRERNRPRGLQEDRGSHMNAHVHQRTR